MDTTTRRPRWLALLLGGAGLLALYRDALTTGFLNDDHLFLEAARTRSPWASLVHPGGLANYFRPLSREFYFAFLAPLAHGSALPFHLVNLAGLLACTWLVFDLLLAFVPEPAAFAGAAYFATLPLMRVDITWISCNQDVFAATGALAALACYRRGKDRAALLLYLAAVLSKQSALPLPAALLAWSVWIDRLPFRRALARVLPLVVPAAVWAAGEWRLRHLAPAGVAHLVTTPSSFAAAFAHEAQSLLGLETPNGLLRGFLDAGPSVLALACLAPIAAWLPERAPAAAPAPKAPRAGAFALTWLVAFGLPLGPVALNWCSYYYTLCAVGAALLVALLARRISRWSWIALVMALLWWHAAVSAVPSFAVADRPWGWTSHLTTGYFTRGARLARQLRLALLRAEPHPPHGTRFFFATLPGWAGFQMGNGPAIRDAYHDDSLQSFFYSQFSESTAAGNACRFLYWNGVDFERLYANARDPFFQVGSDLLLLERPHGARWAFRRGLDAGEEATDHLYWLGWAAFWDGDRATAERSWKAFGAADDTTMYRAWLRAARTVLAAQDTLTARRDLMNAVRAGIGRPEAHAVLGELLNARYAKYALLETRVAAYLKPDDWLARRDLVAGLVAARLDFPARHELDQLEAIYPEWRADTVCARLANTLQARATENPPEVTFARAKSDEAGN